MNLPLVIAAIIMVSMVVEMALPNFLRPDNLFSVTISPESRRHPEVRALIMRWRLANAVIGLVAAGICAATVLLSQSLTLIVLPAILLAYTLVVRAIYAAFHRQAQAFAMPAEGNAMRVSSLRPRRFGSSVPLWWEAAPLAIIALTTIVLATRYPNAPAMVPVHFLNGQADRFAPKSIVTYFGVVGMQFAAWMILTISGGTLIGSRMPTLTGEAAEAYRRMRARQIFALKTATMILLSITVVLTTSGDQSGAAAANITAAAIGGNFVILALTLIPFLRSGQGGWRLERRNDTQMRARGDTTPDGAWIGGMIYYNPDDPAIFVERRTGFGRTMNLGRPESWLILLGMLAIPVLLAMLSQH